MFPSRNHVIDKISSKKHAQDEKLVSLRMYHRRFSDTNRSKNLSESYLRTKKDLLILLYNSVNIYHQSSKTLSRDGLRHRTYSFLFGVKAIVEGFSEIRKNESHL